MTSLLLAAPVEAEDLVVRFGRRQALAGLDLELGQGVHGLLGPNGAGKTTLLRVLATVLPVDGGSVRLLGHDLSDRSALRGVRRRLGYMPQAFGYYPRFTVREFTEYFAWLKEVPSAEVPAAVDRAIEAVGLTERADDRLRTLSGGMLRRAGIAQAIVNDPDVLLLDEPTVGLDPEQRLEFRALLRRLGTDSCVLVSTHLVEDVAAVCSTVTVMREGSRVWQGTPGELAAPGPDGAGGDTPLERGYLQALGRAR